MRSPDYCCPHCGGRDWWKIKEGWVCKHSTPSSDFTDFTAWLSYQVEAELEGRRLLLEWDGKKQVKIDAGKPALIETTEVSRYAARILELESNIRLGTLIEALADRHKAGRIELGSPTLRFYWPSR